MRLWNALHSYQIQNESVIKHGVASCIRQNTVNGIQQVLLKVVYDRGRRRSKWVEILNHNLRSKLDRIRKVGDKLSFSRLRLMDLSLIETSENGIYGKKLVDVQLRKRHQHCLSPRWVKSFADRFCIVSCRRSGNLQLSPEKQKEMEKEVDRNIGKLKIAFEAGT